MQILVLSLPDASDRRALMQGQLALPGVLPYRFVDGIRGADLGPEEQGRICDQSKAEQHLGHPLSAGELGCALGHVKVWQTVVDEGLPWVLVLEDDALLGHQALKLVAALAKRMSVPAGKVILLSHVGRYQGWRGEAVGKIHRLFRPYTAFGSHAYLINLEAAKVLLAAQQPIFTVADDWRFFAALPGLTVQALVPYCIGTAPLASASQIGGERHPPAYGRGWVRWWRKYVYQKFIFQLLVKPALAIRKQESTW